MHIISRICKRFGNFILLCFFFFFAWIGKERNLAAGHWSYVDAYSYTYWTNIFYMYIDIYFAVVVYFVTVSVFLLSCNSVGSSKIFFPYIKASCKHFQFTHTIASHSSESYVYLYKYDLDRSAMGPLMPKGKCVKNVFNVLDFLFDTPKNYCIIGFW